MKIKIWEKIKDWWQDDTCSLFSDFQMLEETILQRKKFREEIYAEYEKMSEKELLVEIAKNTLKM